jgi:hypothetical protein
MSCAKVGCTFHVSRWMKSEVVKIFPSRPLQSCPYIYFVEILQSIVKILTKLWRFYRKVWSLSHRKAWGFSQIADKASKGVESLLEPRRRRRVRRRVGRLDLAWAREHPIRVLIDWCIVWCTTTACIVLASVIAYRMYTLPLPQSHVPSQRSLRPSPPGPSSELNINMVMRRR